MRASSRWRRVYLSYLLSANSTRVDEHMAWHRAVLSFLFVTYQMKFIGISGTGIDDLFLVPFRPGPRLGNVPR